MIDMTKQLANYSHDHLIDLLALLKPEFSSSVSARAGEKASTVLKKQGISSHLLELVK
jgi:hypothetical protein